eukprot:COSAG01_NODE_71050_length_257_cov_0.632911_1_plen_48_part_01
MRHSLNCAITLAVAILFHFCLLSLSLIFRGWPLALVVETYTPLRDLRQ